MRETWPMPTEVQSQLDRFLQAAREAFGEDLLSAVLFGSAAEGRLRPTSDVNLLLVLDRFEQGRADPLRAVFRAAHAAIRLEVMFLLRDELPAAIEAFAVKFGDMLTRRRVLYGPDPLEGVEVSPEALRRRLLQVVLNLSVRLRERYMLVSLREEQLARIVADSAGSLRVCADALLGLEGRPADSPKQALERVVSELDPNDGPLMLELVSQSRERGSLPPGEGGRVLLFMMRLARQLHARVQDVRLGAAGARR